MREGARLAVKCVFSKWVIESDAIKVVRSIKQHAERALESSVVEDIREAMFLRNSDSVCYGSRQGNFRNPVFNKLCFCNL